MDPVGGEEQRLADANGEFEQTDRAGSGETAEDKIERGQRTRPLESWVPDGARKMTRTTGG